MKRNRLLLWLLPGLLNFWAAAQPVPGVPVTTYHFVITELPENTPHDARLFLTGNFTKWNPGNAAYRFQFLPDGSYQLTLRSDLPRIEYKVTRGNWDSVEGRESGKARTNRVVTPTNKAGVQDVDVAILSWEDLSGTFHFYSLYDLLMLFSAFQGLLLLVAIPGIQNNNRPANRWLLLLLGLTSVLILVRTVAAYRDVAQAYTKLLLVPDLILFLYAPLFYVYLRKLLFNTTRPTAGWWRHFVPTLVQIGLYIPLLLMDNKLLQLNIVNRDPWVSGLFLAVGLLGLFYNATYWSLCRRAIHAYRAQYQMSQSTEPQVHYLNTVLVLQAICLALWAFFFGTLLIGTMADFTFIAIAERNVDMIWLVFSGLIYVLGYYAIHQPEVFKLPETEHIPLLETAQATPIPARQEPPPARPTAPVRAEESRLALPTPPAVDATETALALRQQIDTYMERQKPFTNPDLSLAELAVRLRLPPHVLSKMLNEEYQKNFFDFINYHRIEELKRRLADPRFRSYTVLSMAYEVGFNSKTAFNRSFKKLTNQTPSEYLSRHPGAVDLVE